MEATREGSAPCARYEAWLAALASLLLGLLLVGRAAWDADLVYCATDTATVQAPWSRGDAPRNRELSDQGVAFYPHYVRVSERWRAGEAPLWNPDLFLGVPLAANPQWGAYDPQVLALAGLEALGGRALFDRGFAWLAVLRLAVAALGAYLLARELGARVAGAAVAGAGFATSGSLVLWLGYSLAHVTPCLPWLLLGLERLRGARPRRAFALTTASTALAILGGHPETSFFVMLAGALWAWTLLGEARAAALRGFAALAAGALLAAPAWLPFLEYLEHSGALVAHRLAAGERGLPDLVALGAWLVFAWVVLRVRRAALAPAVAALTLGLACCALVWLLAARGLALDFGAADRGFLERGSPWVAPPVLALALAGALSGALAGRATRTALGLGLAALLLALHAPGVTEAWRWLPLVGHAAPARAACLSALFLPLVAGLTLGRLELRARWAALLALGFVAALGLRAGHAAPSPRLHVDPPDEVVTYSERPGERADGLARVAGELHGGLDLDAARLVVEALDERGAPRPGRSLALDVRLGARDAQGTRTFDSGVVDLAGLGAPPLRVTLELARGERVLGRRVVGYCEEVRRGPSVAALALLAATALLLLLRDVRPALAWPALTLAGGVVFAHGWNPAVPRSEHFAPTATERFLAERGGRVLCERGILPGDTSLLAGIANVDGYDALDVASFDGLRAYALKPGANPLLDWDARGMDLASPAFRVLGVRWLLLHGPTAPPGWRVVAGPGHAEHDTEVRICAAEAPLPPAFCVPAVTTRAAALADLASFDPRAVAFLEPDEELELRAPFTRSEVEVLEDAPERQRYAVELDGEGLFVALAQHFPGWEVAVDGAPRRLLRVDSVLRGVSLGPGRHELEVTYRPAPVRRARWLALAGLALAASCLAFTRPKPGAPANEAA